MGHHRRGPWSQQEDGMLLNLVQGQGAHNWVRISQVIQSRSPKQCRERYHQNLKPNLKRDPISKEEGEIIEKMVREMGRKWAEIARALPGRSDNAVKNWWNGGQNRRKRQGTRQNHDLQQPQFPQSLVLHEPREPMTVAHHGGPALAPLQNQRSLPFTSRPGEQTSRSNLVVEQLAPYFPHQSSHLPRPHELPSSTARSLQPAFRPADNIPQISTSRYGRGVESPLPSPSHSAASNEAPSLVSDNSSYTSGRSPHFGSPVELPLPYRWERRRSSCRANGVYDADGNYTEHETPTHASHSDELKTPSTALSEGFPVPQFKTPVWSQPSRRPTSPQDPLKLPSLGSHPPSARSVLPTPSVSPEFARPQVSPMASTHHAQHVSFTVHQHTKGDDSNIDPQLRSPAKDTRMDVSNFLSPQ
ncbi:MAG: hypothetical protein M1821_005347 [Bathelium mastoideum]|nr:MAG: hypothetical protein M1821_005347 [Bathelium mastoideum]KAI9688103.1 MAG: hypothetical protein M1822_001609 [Bathelium mastoideum]